MNMNVGIIDKVVRVVSGLVLIGLTLTGMIGLWGWIGIILLATGVMGWCPLYQIMGMKTCPTEKGE